MILDPATREALERLAESRGQLVDWMITSAARRQASAAEGFQPSSAIMRTLMSVGRMGGLRLSLPMIRWAISAFLMFRSMRKR